MKSLPRLLYPLAALLPLGAASAQHLIAYDPAVFPAAMIETQLPVPFLPGPVPPGVPYATAPALPPAGPGVVPPGDATFDSLQGMSWYTNGLLLAAMESPSFQPTGAIAGPFPIAPAVLGAIGGPVTGLAMNAAAGVLFVCGAPGIVVGIAPVPGTPILVPPFLPPFPMGPVSGLEYDGLTGTLFAVDLGGTVYNFFVGGAPAAAPIGPVPLPAPAGDVALDKTGAVNPLGLRPVYVVGGPVVADVSFPGAPLLPSGGAAPTGLAFLPRPASLMPGAPGCPCGPLLPQFGAIAPMATGNPAFGLQVNNLPALWPVLFAADIAYDPTFPAINLLGCDLGLFLGSPSLLTHFTLSNAAGQARFALPLVGVPPATGSIYAQAFFRCPADPTGFALTPLHHLAVCGL